MDLPNEYSYERNNSDAFERESLDSFNEVTTPSLSGSSTSLYSRDIRFKRQSILPDETHTKVRPSGPGQLAVVKRFSEPQLDLERKTPESVSPVSRFCSSVSTSLNRLHSATSLSSLFSSSSTDGAFGFTIPVRTIPPRPSTLTARAELVAHIEKRKITGYHDVILSEMRDGRILYNHIERPTAETISKINMFYWSHDNKKDLKCEEIADSVDKSTKC